MDARGFKSRLDILMYQVVDLSSVRPQLQTPLLLSQFVGKRCVSDNFKSFSKLTEPLSLGSVIVLRAMRFPSSLKPSISKGVEMADGKKRTRSFFHFLRSPV